MNPLPKPHLGRILLDALRLNPVLRACSLVREPSAGRAAGVCVVLFEADGIRKFGPFLREHLAKLPKQPAVDIRMDLQCTVGDMFEEMERLGLQYAYLTGDIEGIRLLVTLVIGPSVTKHFCAQLTARGCPTRLK